MGQRPEFRRQGMPDWPTPERCVEAYYPQRTRFERIAERKLRQRQLTEDGNVEISGRGFHQLPIASLPQCKAEADASACDRVSVSIRTTAPPRGFFYGPL